MKMVLASLMPQVPLVARHSPPMKIMTLVPRDAPLQPEEAIP
jgi:hypothetical protein